MVMIIYVQNHAVRCYELSHREGRSHSVPIQFLKMHKCVPNGWKLSGSYVLETIFSSPQEHFCQGMHKCGGLPPSSINCYNGSLRKWVSLVRDRGQNVFHAANVEAVGTFGSRNLLLPFVDDNWRIYQKKKNHKIKFKYCLQTPFLEDCFDYMFFWFPFNI